MIDARWIFKTLSGIGRYTINLIQSVLEQDIQNKYILLFDSIEMMHYVKIELKLDQYANVNCHLFPHSVFSMMNQIKLPLLIKKLKIDIFHSPNFMIPLLAPCILIVTIHDLIPLKFPEFAPQSKKSRYFCIYKFLQHIIARRANIVITDSECSREDILELLSIPVSKVKKILLDIDPQFNADSIKRPGIMEQIGDAPYLLYVGRQDPYKNILGLLRIFKKLLQLTSNKLYLIIAGEEDKRYPEYQQFVRDNQLEKVVCFTGYLDHSELQFIYQNAYLFVLPSLYEGFGLTTIEAQACGVPVVASNRASLPEILCESSILLDPDDEKTWIKIILDFMQNPKKRLSWIEKGFQNRKRFSWKYAAQETIKTYQRFGK